jgi:nitrile hydratase
MRMNDVGGMEGFGTLTVSESDPPFHADWEAHVYALTAALVRRGVFALDEFRDEIERMSPADYLGTSYYQRWFLATTNLLRAKGVLPVGGPSDG